MLKRSGEPGFESRRQLGFTLIELLVVVVIIALLVAILIPALAPAKTQAKRAVCQGNLSAVGKAAAMYDMEFSVIPICWANIDPAELYPWSSWRASLLPYLSSFEALNCPSVFDQGVCGERFHSVAEVTGDWMERTANAGSYGVIYQQSLPSYTPMNYAGVYVRANPVWTAGYSTEPGVAWRHPAASVYVADAVYIDGPITYPSGPGHKGYGSSTIFPPSDPMWHYQTGYPITRRFACRHVDTTCLFADGHVQGYETRKLDNMVAGSGDCIWDTE